MNTDKIGTFLKQLRKERKMTQDDIAKRLHADRTKINRIENGRRLPNIEDLLFYSEIFDISIDELIACERKTKDNEKRIKTKFITYLRKQNTKCKKMKLIMICVLFLLLTCFISMAILYFFQNYNSIKIYSFYGRNDNYEILDGILIISKDEIYFDVGKISPSTKSIGVISEINGKKEIIYEGDYNNILNDKYDYKSFISYQDFLNGNQKIYIEINNEEILLNFREEFTNNKFYYKKNEIIGNHGDITKTEIPVGIQEKFKCDKHSCTLNEGTKTMFYNLGIFTLIEGNLVITYDVKTNSFVYDNQKENIYFSINNDNVMCEKGNCENSAKIYEDFEKNYIKKYLKTK